jgi:LysM repeat protein
MIGMSHPADRTSRRHYYARIGVLLVLVGAGALAACGSDNSHANDTLPPIATTTTTTTMPPTTTTIPDKYTIQKGESLSGIAKMFGLTTAELAAFNGISNPEYIQAGQVLKIPQPGETTTSTTPSSVIDATSVAPTTTI